MENIKQKERACVYCGQVFVTNNARKKLCSAECVNKYRKEYAKRRFAKPEIKARVKAYQEKNKEKIKKQKQEIHQKYVQRPEVIAQIKEYHKKYMQREGVRDKINQREKEHRKTERGYLISLKNRIKQRGKTNITYDDLYNLMTSSNTCYYCGKPIFILGKEKTVDHKIPTSKEGTNELNNLVVCCRHCNFTKRDMTEKEYFEYMGKVKNERIK